MQAAQLQRQTVQSKKITKENGILLPTSYDRHHDSSSAKRPIGCLSIIGLILLTIVLTIGATLWVVNSQFFTRSFKPVSLNTTEEEQLSVKLAALGDFSKNSDPEITATQREGGQGEASQAGEIQPELYSEDPSKRTIELSERELNALLAKNTDLAEQLVVDLANNLASVKLLVDLDPDLPFVGGKTLKVSSGVGLSYSRNRPVVVMKGLSVWGIPIPNAWLGGLKNIDLVQEFGGNEGFWKSFAAGIDDIRVEDDKLLIQLAE